MTVLVILIYPLTRLSVGGEFFGIFLDFMSFLTGAVCLLLCLMIALRIGVYLSRDGALFRFCAVVFILMYFICFPIYLMVVLTIVVSLLAYLGVGSDLAIDFGSLFVFVILVCVLSYLRYGVLAIVFALVFAIVGAAPISIYLGRKELETCEARGGHIIEKYSPPPMDVRGGTYYKSCKGAR
jgi:hypothetical protein